LFSLVNQMVSNTTNNKSKSENTKQQHPCRHNSNLTFIFYNYYNKRKRKSQVLCRKFLSFPKGAAAASILSARGLIRYIPAPPRLPITLLSGRKIIPHPRPVCQLAKCTKFDPDLRPKRPFFCALFSRFFCKKA